jgi:hypothetical protein
MHKPRVHRVVVALALLAFSALCEATDLRGRIDAKNTYSGADGMYYLPGIAAGKYVLVVNGQRFPLVVNNQPYQDVPVVVLR